MGSNERGKSSLCPDCGHELCPHCGECHACECDDDDLDPDEEEEDGSEYESDFERDRR